MVDAFHEVKAMFADTGALFEADRYQKAIMSALKVEHDDGVQSGVAIFEGMALTLSHLIADLPPREQAGMMEYVRRRALELAPNMQMEGCVTHIYRSPEKAASEA